jgi:PAS domain S-box-containing protein
LRQPPFDVAPHFTLADIWQKYWWELLALIVLGSVILLLILQLALLNRRLTEQRRAADRRAEERHGLLAALGDGVYGVDARGLCTFINPAALAMLGLSEGEVLGRDQHELFHHHHEDGSPYPAAECPIAMTLADGRLRRCEEWFVRKDGIGFPIVLTANAVGGTGAHAGAVVVFRDISERRRLEQELRDEAITDALTRLPNRRYFLAEMDRHLAHLHRGEARPAAIMMLDLDCFKAVVRVERQEFGRELVVAVEGHPVNLVGQAQLFQQDRHLHPVGRGQAVELQAVRVRGGPLAGDRKSVV